MKFPLLPLALTGGVALLLCGCYSDQEIAAARAVITALPEEVRGCTFLGNVDAAPRGTIENARFEIQYAAAQLGATHVVETHAYAGNITRQLLGVGLSGRAYRCPEGAGPRTTAADARLRFDPNTELYLLEQLPWADD